MGHQRPRHLAVAEAHPYRLLGHDSCIWLSCTSALLRLSRKWATHLLQGPNARAMAFAFARIFGRHTAHQHGMLQETAYAVRFPASNALGATINMDGTGYLPRVCAISLLPRYSNRPHHWPTMRYRCHCRVLSSIGTAVPGSAMIMPAMVLQSVGLPVEGNALVAGVRPRSGHDAYCVNITVTSVHAVCVNALENRKETRQAAKAAVSGRNKSRHNSQRSAATRGFFMPKRDVSSDAITTHRLPGERFERNSHKAGRSKQGLVATCLPSLQNGSTFYAPAHSVGNTPHGAKGLHSVQSFEYVWRRRPDSNRG